MDSHYESAALTAELQALW